MNTETELDLRVLEDLDFEPSCESHWHSNGLFPEAEPATHFAKFHCPHCGHACSILMGNRCITRMYAKRVFECIACKQAYDHARHVTLEPL